MPLYTLVIGDAAPLSIFADSDEGAQMMMRTCFSDAAPADVCVRLTEETAGRIVIDTTAGDMLMSV